MRPVHGHPVVPGAGPERDPIREVAFGAVGNTGQGKPEHEDLPVGRHVVIDRGGDGLDLGDQRVGDALARGLIADHQGVAAGAGVEVQRAGDVGERAGQEVWPLPDRHVRAG